MHREIRARLEDRSVTAKSAHSLVRGMSVQELACKANEARGLCPCGRPILAAHETDCEMSYQAQEEAGVPREVLDSEIELANSATMEWLEKASDTAVVMYAKAALQRICLLCRKPGHLAAQCPNGCRHCGAKPDKATGWALHKSTCPIKQRQ